MVTIAHSTVAAPPAIDRPATATRQAERGLRGANRSLRFYGTGSGDIDRVKIPLTSATPVNVGATDLTIEFWIKGSRTDNTATGCGTGDAAWINGNIVLDRDVYGSGDRGDFGIALFGGRIAFGASRGGSGATVCGTRDVLDGRWHHVAVTRRAATGGLRIWVDGSLDGDRPSSPATGDIGYRIGRATSWPGSDPFVVLGAEKHDAGPEYPSFSGWLDDLRISTTVRYASRFDRPVAPLVVDSATAASYRFDETSGTVVVDAVGRSNGVLRVGGPNLGPHRSDDHPFSP